MTVLEIDTPHGLARAHLHPVDDPVGALALGHGANGGVGARDLVAATKAANAEGYAVALVEQPYVVAGRRSPAPAKQLDAAWTAVVEQLREAELAGLPLVTGGRAAGARVASPTPSATRAPPLLWHAFPVQTPGRPARSSTGSRCRRS